MKLSFYFSVVVSVSLFLGSCSLPKIEKEAPEINVIAPNSEFCIILPENHTTGYLWQLSPTFDEGVVTHINDVWHGNEKGIYLNFSSLSAGQTTLSFVSRKYQDTAEIKHFIVKIERD
ncbi:hypothetical protein CNR22_07330 [Sphingobacteriaceae bacterium]|nr:hypothetical protein CNR22_07330 [Sphingobacteriaceae bacterium]